MLTICSIIDTNLVKKYLALQSSFPIANKWPGAFPRLGSIASLHFRSASSQFSGGNRFVAFFRVFVHCEKNTQSCPIGFRRIHNLPDCFVLVTLTSVNEFLICFVSNCHVIGTVIMLA